MQSMRSQRVRHDLATKQQQQQQRNIEDKLIDQLVKDLPAMQETLIQFLGQEVSLEKG